MQKQFTVTAMSCALCKMHVEDAVRALPGVKARVNLASKIADVQNERSLITSHARSKNTIIVV